MGNKILTFSFILILILFIAGIYNIFSIRFRIGDVYPPYSSLRSDPLGTKIFYKSLSSFKNHTVQRNYRSVPKWEGGKTTTLFILGAYINSLERPGKDTYLTLSRLLSSGTRLVISLYPPQQATGTESLKNKEINQHKKDQDNSRKTRQDKTRNKAKKNKYSLLKLWGVKISRIEDNTIGLSTLTEKPESINLPSSIKFPSTFYFIDPDNKWTINYSLKAYPTIVSRRFGGGTIILCADSYIFSNEAMMYDRYPRLLSWFTGPGKQIYFDESHFGIQKTQGIIDLAYKYRLQGVIAVFLLMAILYIWKNATHFVPPHDKDYERETGLRAERDYLDGLTSLLQRYIPAGDLIKTCIKEWENSSVLDKAYLRSGIPSSEELEKLAVRHKDPSQIYNAICNQLTERKRL